MLFALCHVVIFFISGDTRRTETILHRATIIDARIERANPLRVPKEVDLDSRRGVLSHPRVYHQGSATRTVARVLVTARGTDPPPTSPGRFFVDARVDSNANALR